MRFCRMLLVLCTVLSAGAADDPFNGTWKLNPGKSKYTPGPPPQSAVVTIQSDGETANVNLETVFEKTTFKSSYAAKRDGTPAPITGSPVADMVSTKRLDDRTIEIRSTKAGKQVNQARARLSPDGKTMTVSGAGLNPAGMKMKYTAVYEKQ